ncbi:MAG: PQQ-dependent dehydrogenase, methanol/ethanol family [Sphingobium sp.]|nr:PQQ-dependent dehydrogenase, methanol/ethanol family [Sphingobium sp.]
MDMKKMRLWGLAPLVLLAGAAAPDGPRVDGAAIAKGNDADWLSYGRTYDEQRYSPLDAINTGNVGQLGLAWYADMGPGGLTQEGTPLAIDGKLYVVTSWSKVKAYDGATGALLWDYDPKVPGETLAKSWDAFSRGLAAWGNALYLATFDGRLIALDRATGKPLWSVVTVDQSKPYNITGAPRVVNGMVIVGNAGADMGVRGYVTAYDTRTGKQLWRFYTVPDAPGKNKEAYLKRAEATWHGDYWKTGGGGTVWDAMAYDPALDLLYIGVGNGSLWNQSHRSPGGGDNLYISSIVAIHAGTGQYAWHFQETPGETWDYTATQHIMLADLEIDGKPRKVLLHAPKNGFFYVIDRANGQFISGNNYVPVNWAKGLDPKTGRPIENPEARFDRTGKGMFVMPSAQGGHNWHPMAYDAKQKLVFIPGQHSAFPYVSDKNWKQAPIGFNTGIDLASLGGPGGPVPGPEVMAALGGPPGALIAWDPVAQKERWRIRQAGGFNGGLLATAGGLLFQGSPGGRFSAMESASGKPLWSFPTQTGVLAAPITFKAGGLQYVAVLAGAGTTKPVAPGMNVVPNIGRLMVFRLGGTATLPPAPAIRRAEINPPADPQPKALVDQGRYHFMAHCAFCHGANGAVGPDLRTSGALRDPKAWAAIVHDGALAKRGMVGWSTVLSPAEVEAIRAYFIGEAQAYKAQQEKASAVPARIQ